MADAERKNPHDALFKDVFSRPENALAVFRAELPPSLGASLHSLRPATTEYQDELRRSFGDLVFTARLGRARTQLSLLFEHQRDPDPLEPFRLLRYSVREWDRWLRDHPRARKLPAVLSLVLYQGARPWRGPRRLTDLLDLPPEVVRELENVPELEPRLIELATADSGRLDRLSGSPLARVALGLMQRAADPRGDLLALFEELAPQVRQVFEGHEGRTRLSDLVSYTCSVRRDVEMEELSRRLRRIVGDDAGGVAMSTVREIHEQGRVEGRVEATRGMLARFLRGRFGPDALTAPIRDRIASATLDQLEAWADAVSHADSVDDVFGS